MFDASSAGRPYGATPGYAASFSWQNTLGDMDRSNPQNYSPDWLSPNIGVWHLKGTNVLFLDGHVQKESSTSEVTFHDFDDSDWDLPSY